MSERRKAYRETTGLEAIGVRLSWPYAQRVQATLVDLSAGGAAIYLTGVSTDIPRPAIDSTVNLDFHLEGHTPIRDVAAVVRNQREENGKQVLGLQIADWVALNDQLPQHMLFAFNRRKHYRLNLSKQAPCTVTVEITASGDVLEGKMLDISIGGCLTQLPEENSPCKGDNVRLRFSFAEISFNFDLVAVTRSAIAYKHSVNCGFEFTDNGTKDFEAQQERIANYAAQIQREHLRNRPTKSSHL